MATPGSWLTQQRRALGLASIAVGLALWQALAVGGFLSPRLLPSPLAIAQRGWEATIAGIFLPHVGASLQFVLLGVFAALVAGVPLGITMGRSPRVRRVLDPYVNALYATPIVALLPLLILWFGVGPKSSFVLVFLGAVFAIVINTAAGAESIDESMIEMARSLKAGPLQTAWHVVLPACVPYIMVGLRLAIGRALIMIFAAEFFAANQGLGYLVIRSSSSFDTPLAYFGILTFGLLGIIAAELLRLAERSVAPWRFSRS